jgi:hypothetical protein
MVTSFTFRVTGTQWVPGTDRVPSTRRMTGIYRQAGLLAATALLLAGCAAQSTRMMSLAGPTASGGGAATQVIPANPYVGSPSAAGVAIALTVTGDCQSSNKDAADRNAFRCFIEQTDPDGGNIEDPCFAPPAGGNDGSLLCLSSPDARTGVRVVPSAPPDADAPAADADPWYVQLSDGTRCGLMGGATDELDGLRLNYECLDGSYLYGDPRHTAPYWTISRRAGAAAASQVQIARAWM